jgi:inosine/xanthosine triphosphatase
VTKITIAVGSTNPAKLQAVRLSVRRAWPAAVVSGVAVPTGVSTMPFSDAECIAGARRRAREARRAQDALLGIGLEGGANEEPAGLMLLGWVVVEHADGREGLAATARLPLPSKIADPLRAGAELGPLMDRLLGEARSNHRGGAIGALTAGLVPRPAAFAMAVSYALAPFLAPRFYEA